MVGTTHVNSNLSNDFESVYEASYSSDPTTSKTFALGSYNCKNALLIICGASTNSNTVFNSVTIDNCTYELVTSVSIPYGSLSTLAYYRIYKLSDMNTNTKVSMNTYCRTVKVELIKIM